MISQLSVSHPSVWASCWLMFHSHAYLFQCFVADCFFFISLMVTLSLSVLGVLCSSIGPPRSKPCLVNRTRSLSLDNTSSNEDCGPDGVQGPQSHSQQSASVANAIAKAAAASASFKEAEQAHHSLAVNANSNRANERTRPHDLDLRATKMFHLNSPLAHAACRGDHCKAMEWTEPIVCSSPRPLPSSGKLTLVVDDTRFLVDADLFKAHPETMLGR